MTQPARLAQVSAYLLSPGGRGTSALVARALLSIDSRALGLGERPSLAELHRTRKQLEQVCALSPTLPAPP